ncbi:hypothetical protein FB45DRAFT_1040172 [Roridomyces roridus]|uniref:Uncharacterized protein n=1 Tax=Roridomyces roridus TaxID=1738132 RepID=A0AAD7FA23_9AGAR|nr:hypothetical protein FB45DRAFT_1040172 [Roridomyces roridus]
MVCRRLWGQLHPKSPTLMDNDAPLPVFTRLGPTEPFSVLHKLLWPTTGQRDPAQDEPECLSKFIEKWTPTGSSDDQEPQSTIRYIDLTKNPSLQLAIAIAFHPLES